MKVQTNVLSALDQETFVVVLVVLDLSVILSITNNKFLLSRLYEFYGIPDLAWVSSYLSDRLQRF